MPADETCVPVGVALSNPMGLISSHRRQTGVDGCQKSIGFDVILLGSVLLSRFFLFCFMLCTNIVAPDLYHAEYSGAVVFLASD